MKPVQTVDKRSSRHENILIDSEGRYPYRGHGSLVVHKRYSAKLRRLSARDHEPPIPRGIHQGEPSDGDRKSIYSPSCSTKIHGTTFAPVVAGSGRIANGSQKKIIRRVFGATRLRLSKERLRRDRAVYIKGLNG